MLPAHVAGLHVVALALAGTASGPVTVTIAEGSNVRYVFTVAPGQSVNWTDINGQHGGLGLQITATGPVATLTEAVILGAP
ncbi:MAG: hypothetical protein ACYCZM_11925 [Acidimicrobiales bacterium]